MFKRVAQLIFIQNDQLALGFRQNVEHENNVWGFPGGRQEPGETIETTARREAREEVGVDPSSLRCLAVLTDDRDIEHHFFICDAWTGELHNNEPERCRDIQWFPCTDLPNNCSAITYLAQTLLHER